MDCKTTSIKRKAAGFTLTEFLMATGIGGMILAVVASLTFFSAKSFAAMANYTDLSAESRDALDRITSDIRACKKVADSSNPLILVLSDADGRTLRYMYNSRARTLTRIQQTGPGTSVSEVILTECDNFKYNMFARNPVGGTYNQYPASSSTTCKLVQVNWTCSRQILGRKENTISVQTAKVVLRAQKSKA